jgi:hypothetical protein
MNDVLQALVGCQVQVYSVRGETEISDIGTLESYDSNWLCLSRNGGTLYFSISRIRLIKPL